MNISAPFIGRPVATTLLTLGIAAAGVVAFRLLPVASLPNIDLPAVFVSASFPGASPEVMASTVATPLERHLGAIADVNDMTSTSTVGSTNIQLTFGIDRNINGAARDVEAAIEAAQADLPTGIPMTPTYREINTSRFSIMTLAMTSSVLSQGQIYDAADAVISQRLAQIKGVGGVNVSGSALPAVRVDLNPVALAQYGIGLQDVVAAISNANANSPKGVIDIGPDRYQIYTNDNARDAGAYRNLIIASRNGGYVRLKDVATISGIQDGATANILTYGIYNGKPAVTVDVLKEPGANVIDVVNRVKAELPSLEAAINPAIRLKVTSDRSMTIEASLHRVEETLVIAVIMVVLVVYVFLSSVLSALVPAVVIPTALVGTFGAMYLLGFTLDNFSLMALTVATGFLVDDAIVVMENITRHIEAGMPRMQAALTGAREVGFTVLAMSLSLLAVFLPLEMMGGIVGRLFGEFAISLSVAILISLALSLTTTPMMCARLLARRRRRPSGNPGMEAAVEPPRPRAFDRGFAALRGSYERSLGWVLDHRFLVLLGLFAVIGLNVFFYVVVPKGFFPEEDTGQLRGAMRADPFASFDLVKSKFKQVAKIIQSDPAVASVTGSVGGGSWFARNASASFDVTLKPLSDRRLSADQVLARLQPRLDRVPGVHSFLQVQQSIGGGGGGRSSNTEYQYSLLGDNLAELRTWTDKLRVALAHVPELTDIDSDLQPGGLEANLIVDRNTAYRLGLSEAQIDQALRDSFAQAQVSTIYNPASPQQYHVVMQVAPRFWRDPAILKDLYISTAGGPASGTELTQAVAGTTKYAGSSANPSAAAVAANRARNQASNSLANAGRGNTSTGAAVSVSAETVVPFSAFSHFEIGTTPVSVTHTGDSASTSISFNLPVGGSLGAALAAIRRTMNLIHMPADIHGSAYGTARLFQQNAGEEPLMLLAAFLAIYIVLGMLYESYAHPLIILSTIPSGGLGALLALIMTGTQLSLVAFLGIIMLIGIVMKNAIMMVDFALDGERTLGLDPVTAIARACSLRFRPIMMTTCAAIAGALPLAIAWGQGTAMRRPLGISIVGGLIVSQALTIFTTPVVYLYVHPRAKSKRVARSVAPPLAPVRPGTGMGA
ncbi:MAG: efflux RND transporter permease subunit [Steroidobacteraceae bacterium]